MVHDKPYRVDIVVADRLVPVYVGAAQPPQWQEFSQLDSVYRGLYVEQIMGVDQTVLVYITRDDLVLYVYDDGILVPVDDIDRVTVFIVLRHIV